jgi:hypothetical protein
MRMRGGESEAVVFLRQVGPERRICARHHASLLQVVPIATGWISLQG